MGLKGIMRYAKMNINTMQMKSCFLVFLVFLMLFSKVCIVHVYNSLSCQIKCKENQKYLWFIRT